MHDVFFFEAFQEEQLLLRQYLPDGIRAGFTGLTIQEHGAHVPPATLISTRTQSRVPEDWQGSLRGLLSRSTGYDHVLELLRRPGPGPVCGYLPEYCTRAVAEQALLLWMALLRRLPRQIACMDTFTRDGLTGAECSGRTLHVAGVGRIGSKITAIGCGLGMQVIGTDLVERHPEVDYVPLSVGLARADIIVCAMNLTARNAGIFNRATLGQARCGAIFVNIARGELSPAVDLLHLLDSGVLGGVGLDVHEHEGDLAASLRSGRHYSDAVRVTENLRTRANVILTPHNAFNTVEALQRKARQSCEQVERFLANGTFQWPVTR